MTDHASLRALSLLSTPTGALPRGRMSHLFDDDAADTMSTSEPNWAALRRIKRNGVIAASSEHPTFYGNCHTDASTEWERCGPDVKARFVLPETKDASGLRVPVAG